MARRILIITKDTEIDASIKQMAENNNCPEIVHGIPPRLKGIIYEAGLPMVFEEPEYPPPPKPIDIYQELEDIRLQMVKYEGRVSRLELELGP